CGHPAQVVRRCPSVGLASVTRLAAATPPLFHPAHEPRMARSPIAAAGFDRDDVGRDLAGGGHPAQARGDVVSGDQHDEETEHADHDVEDDVPTGGRHDRTTEEHDHTDDEGDHPDSSPATLAYALIDTSQRRGQL